MMMLTKQSQQNQHDFHDNFNTLGNLEWLVDSDENGTKSGLDNEDEIINDQGLLGLISSSNEEEAEEEEEEEGEEEEEDDDYSEHGISRQYRIQETYNNSEEDEDVDEGFTDSTREISKVFYSRSEKKAISETFIPENSHLFSQDEYDEDEEYGVFTNDEAEYFMNDHEKRRLVRTGNDPDDHHHSDNSGAHVSDTVDCVDTDLNQSEDADDEDQEEVQSISSSILSALDLTSSVRNTLYTYLPAELRDNIIMQNSHKHNTFTGYADEQDMVDQEIEENEIKYKNSESDSGCEINLKKEKDNIDLMVPTRLNTGEFPESNGTQCTINNNNSSFICGKKNSGNNSTSKLNEDFSHDENRNIFSEKDAKKPFPFLKRSSSSFLSSAINKKYTSNKSSQKFKDKQSVSNVSSSSPRQLEPERGKNQVKKDIPPISMQKNEEKNDDKSSLNNNSIEDTTDLPGPAQFENYLKKLLNEYDSLSQSMIKEGIVRNNTPDTHPKQVMDISLSISPRKKEDNENHMEGINAKSHGEATQINIINNPQSELINQLSKDAKRFLTYTEEQNTKDSRQSRIENPNLLKSKKQENDQSEKDEHICEAEEVLSVASRVPSSAKKNRKLREEISFFENQEDVALSSNVIGKSDANTLLYKKIKKAQDYICRFREAFEAAEQERTRLVKLGKALENEKTKIAGEMSRKFHASLELLKSKTKKFKANVSQIEAERTKNKNLISDIKLKNQEIANLTQTVKEMELERTSKELKHRATHNRMRTQVSSLTSENAKLIEQLTILKRQNTQLHETIRELSVTRPRTSGQSPSRQSHGNHITNGDQLASNNINPTRHGIAHTGPTCSRTRCKSSTALSRLQDCSPQVDRFGKRVCLTPRPNHSRLVMDDERRVVSEKKKRSCSLSSSPKNQIIGSSKSPSIKTTAALKKNDINNSEIFHPQNIDFNRNVLTNIQELPLSTSPIHNPESSSGVPAPPQHYLEQDNVLSDQIADQEENKNLNNRLEPQDVANPTQRLRLMDELMAFDFEEIKERAESTLNRFLNNAQIVTEEISTDGKIFRLFADGRKELLYPNGLRKLLTPDGWHFVLFSNGDLKALTPQALQMYKFHVGILQISTSTGKKYTLFPDGQREYTEPSNRLCCVIFKNGIRKFLHPQKSDETIPSMN